MATRSTHRPAKGTPTALNVSALVDVLVENATDGVLTAVSPTAVPHVRRCIAAGLLVPAGRGAWMLSAEGAIAVQESAVATAVRCSRPTGSRPMRVVA